MGHFSEDTLKKFNEMCADGFSFSEGEIYDFARCITSKGEIYGVSKDEACKIGKRIPDKKPLDNKAAAARMAILKKAFIKRTGREMTKEEIARAARLVNSMPEKELKLKGKIKKK